MSGRFANVLETIGRTPVIRINKLAPDGINLFAKAESFNQPLNSWNVSTVEDASFMFQSAGVFNQDLSTWDVSRMTSARYMFASTLDFNIDLSSWDVSNVQDFTGMFKGATGFNQDLCRWGEIINTQTAVVTEMFEDSGCPTQVELDLLGTPPGPFCAACS